MSVPNSFSMFLAASHWSIHILHGFIVFHAPGRDRTAPSRSPKVDSVSVLQHVPAPRISPRRRRSEHLLGLNLALPDDRHARSCYASMMWPQRLGDALRPVPGVLGVGRGSLRGTRATCASLAGSQKACRFIERTVGPQRPSWQHRNSCSAAIPRRDPRRPARSTSKR